MSDLQKGDRVQLNSGGPVMTVENLGGFSSAGIEDGALCVWFDKNKSPQEKVFDCSMLTKIEDED